MSWKVVVFHVRAHDACNGPCHVVKSGHQLATFLDATHQRTVACLPFWALAAAAVEAGVVRHEVIRPTRCSSERWSAAAPAGKGQR